MHLAVYLGLLEKQRSRKQRRSRTVEKQRSRQGKKSRKAKSREAEQWRSREAKKHKSRIKGKAEKQKAEKQAGKQKSKKNAQNGKKKIPKQYSPPYIIDMKESPELHPNSFNSGDKTPWTWKPRPGLMPIELEPSSWKGPAPWNRTAERFDVVLCYINIY